MTPGRDQLADLLSSLRNASLRYADIRFPETRKQHVKVRNGEIDHLASTVNRAVAVRVLAGAGWGFAAPSDLSEPSLRATARSALEVAAASNIGTTQKVFLSEIAPFTASWESPFRIDPWSISLDRKTDHLLAATEPMRGDPRIHQVSGEISCYRQRKVFVSTVGSAID